MTTPVGLFADKMRQTYERHHPEKGLTWRQMPEKDLAGLMGNEAIELLQALKEGDVTKATEEAVDVALLASFILDNDTKRRAVARCGIDILVQHGYHQHPRKEGLWRMKDDTGRWHWVDFREGKPRAYMESDDRDGLVADNSRLINSIKAADDEDQMTLGGFGAAEVDDD